VSPLSLLTFFAAAKKVSPAPDRGNACAPARNRGAGKKQKQPQKDPLQSKKHRTNARAPAPHRVAEKSTTQPQHRIQAIFDSLLIRPHPRQRYQQPSTANHIEVKNFE
jgi:hypothetical protein